jgi:carbon-monoxide dehydrogenase small subunit
MRRTWILNGEEVVVEFPPLRRLLDILREDLGLKGTKEGCGEGECGACTVVIDGRPLASCLVPAGQLADGTEILTVEGLEKTETGRVLQDCFAKTGAVQCGFCTPGMLLSSYALLTRHPQRSKLTDSEIRTALAGNICRCTGYVKIVEAVKIAGEIR